MPTDLRTALLRALIARLQPPPAPRAPLDTAGRTPVVWLR